MAELKFKIPEGWAGMDDLEEGEDSDFVSKIRLNGDGTATIIQVEGIDIDGSMEAVKEKVTEKPETDQERERRFELKYRPSRYSGGEA